MRYDESVAVVLAWQDAANHQDVDRLLELSDPNIEIVGPRGSGRGHKLLRDWIGRAGLSLETLRVFADGDSVVVAQRGAWRSANTGEVIGESRVASGFRVDDQRVTWLARYDSLDAALDETNLRYTDEMPEV